MSFEINGIDDMMQSLRYLDAERLAPAMLKEAVPIVKAAVVKRASMHRRTGAMVSSIKETKVTRNQYGYYICVRPTGKDEKGVRNMEKMAVLEYGSGRQAATPVLVPAVRESEEKVLEKMQEVFDREVDM